MLTRRGSRNHRIEISVKAELDAGDVTCGLPYEDPDAPEQADPDTDMAALLEAFKNIRFDDFHDVDFSDAQKENLLVHVRGSGGEGGGGRG